MSDIPIVFVSSTTSGVGVVVTVGVNKSSFITGPFSLDMLATGVRTLLEEACSLSKGIPVLRREKTVLGLCSAAVACGKRGVRLAGGRFHVLRALVRGGKHIIDESALVAGL